MRSASAPLPLLHGETEVVREFSYGYYWTRGRNPLNVKEYVRDYSYKYYRSGELYDPELDPEEKNPLQGPEYEQVIERMKENMNSVRLPDMKK